MNVFQIMDYLGSVEQEFDVQNWTINDIHIWPSLKIHIYYKIFEHYDENFSFKSSSDSFMQKMKRRYNFLLSYLHSRMGQKKKYYDALILDDGVSYDFIDNKWFGKFTDTIKEKLESENTPSLTLSKSKFFLFPRHSDYYSVLLPLKIRQIRNRISPISQNVKLERLDKLQIQLEKKFPEIKWNLLPFSKSSALMIEICSEYYKKLIRKFKPKKCYVTNYYGNAGFCKACWDLSIPLHEIQHGVQGYGHVAYSDWTNVPEKGFNTLPKNFACWQRADIDVIEEWADKTPHDSYILGNLYLEKMKNEKTQTYVEFENFLKTLQNQHKKHYLITLQTGMGLPKSIIDILKKCPEIFFWIRMHPTSVSEMPDVIQKLKEENISNYNIEKSTKTPLYIVMAFMNGHITLNSSTVIEAAYFNIPSWILDETGALYYKEYIKQGIAFYETKVDVGVRNLEQLCDGKDL